MQALALRPGVSSPAFRLTEIGQPRPGNPADSLSKSPAAANSQYLILIQWLRRTPMKSLGFVPVHLGLNAPYNLGLF
ncbi:hypothetical protein SDJN03_07263, partial [Cucurbita argyrosperma subsp. sororia]